MWLNISFYFHKMFFFLQKTRQLLKLLTSNRQPIPFQIISLCFCWLLPSDIFCIICFIFVSIYSSVVKKSSWSCHFIIPMCNIMYITYILAKLTQKIQNILTTFIDWCCNAIIYIILQKIIYYVTKIFVNIRRKQELLTFLTL